MVAKVVVPVGVENIKEVLAFGFPFVKAIKDSKEDGFGLNDFGNFSIVIPKFPAAIEDADKIPAEVKDMSKAELADIILFSGGLMEGSPKDKEILEKINKTLIAVIAIFEAVKAWK